MRLIYTGRRLEYRYDTSEMYYWRFTWRYIAMLSAEVTSLGYRLFFFSEYDATRSHEARGPATTLDLWARTDFRPRDLPVCLDPRSIYLRRRCSRRMNMVKWSITHALSSNSYLPVRYHNSTR